MVDMAPTKDTEASAVVDTLSAAELKKSTGTTSKEKKAKKKLEVPVEIRLMIWKLMSYQTRNIPISFQQIGDRPGLDSGEENGDSNSSCEGLIWRVANHLPVVLRVCRESREEALKHYTLDLAVEHHWAEKFNYRSTPVYINWEMDRLCIIDTPDFFGDDPSFLYDLLFLIGERGLRSIALNAASWNKENENALLSMISYGEGICVEEVLLFHADSSFMHQKVMEERVALELYVSSNTSDRSSYPALLGNGEYCDESTDKEKATWQFVDLLSAEINLIEGFKLHEELLAGSNNPEAKGELAEWTRPEVDWCAVEVKYPLEESSKMEESTEMEKSAKIDEE